MSLKSAGQSVFLEGRIVWGQNLFTGNPVLDHNTKQPKINPKTNTQDIQFAFGLAVPKSQFTPEKMQQGGPGFIMSAMQIEARQIFPSGQIPPKFAWKYKDGDSIDDKGVPFNQRKGYAGCYVFALSGYIAPKWFIWNNDTKQNVQVTQGIKCGDWVKVQVSVKAHPSINNGLPGMYLNPDAAQLIGYGEEIINAPSGDQMFGAQAPVTPQGASEYPVGNPNMQFGVAPQTPQYAPQAPQGMPDMPQQQYTPPPPQQAAQPHYGILPEVHQPQAQQPMHQMPGMPQMGNVPVQQMQQPAGFPPAAAPTAQMPMMQNQVGPSSNAYPSNQMPGMPQPGVPMQPQYPQQAMPQQQMQQMPGVPQGFPGYPQQ